MISCDRSVCKDEVKYNGYFTSDDGTLIKCVESECNIEYIVDSSCNGHSGEVITMNNKPKYCNGKVSMNLDTDKSGYFILNNIKAEFTYPNIEKGNDTIIIQSTRYSVTQITTTEEGK